MLVLGLIIASMILINWPLLMIKNFIFSIIVLILFVIAFLMVFYFGWRTTYIDPVDPILLLSTEVRRVT